MANLKVAFTVWQTEGDCNTLYFEDITPNGDGGYGGINPSREEVATTRLYIGLPSGDTYLFDGIYKPHEGSVMRLKPSHFTKQRLQTTAPLNDGLPCAHSFGNTENVHSQVVNNFQDGCYKVLYEVLSEVKVPARKCTYDAHGLWQTGWTFWATRDGAEYNLTSLITVLDGEFWYRVEKTIQVYTEWRIKNAEGITECSGTFEKYDCFNSSTARQTTDEPVVVSSSNMELTMLCQIKQRQRNGAFQLVVSGCRSNDLSEERALMMYTLGSDKLEGLEHRTEECNCDCAKETLKQIDELFTYIGI